MVYGLKSSKNKVKKVGAQTKGTKLKNKSCVKSHGEGGSHAILITRHYYLKKPYDVKFVDISYCVNCVIEYPKMKI